MACRRASKARLSANHSKLFDGRCIRDPEVQQAGESLPVDLLNKFMTLLRKATGRILFEPSLRWTFEVLYKFVGLLQGVDISCRMRNFGRTREIAG